MALKVTGINCWLANISQSQEMLLLYENVEPKVVETHTGRETQNAKAFNAFKLWDTVTI